MEKCTPNCLKSFIDYALKFLIEYFFSIHCLLFLVFQPISLVFYRNEKIPAVHLYALPGAGANEFPE
jgi:hypothetical protein